MADSDSDDSDQGEQVRISLKLASSVQDRSLEVPSEPIAVPADIGRKGLSAVINHLLGRTNDDNKDDSDDDDDDDDDSKNNNKNNKFKQLNFEFVLKGTPKLLRKGVEKEARQYGISLEQAISITYFPATNAPNPQDDQEQLPDWISSISILSSLPNTTTTTASSLSPSLLFAGCYDGTLHVYKDNGTQKVTTTSISTGPVKCVDTFHENDDDNDDIWIATSCLDHTTMIHNYDTTNETLVPFASCIQGDGNSASFSCLKFRSNLLMGGNDNGGLYMWDVTNKNDNEDGVVKESLGKKQKTSKNGGYASTTTTTTTKQLASIMAIDNGHSQLISGISWGNHDLSNKSTVLSGSWDHSLKLWDVEKQDCIMTLNGSRVVSCLDTSYHSEGIVATGHPDCTIRLWDVRTNNNGGNLLDQKQSSSSIIADTTFRPSHRAWVSAVQWSQQDAYQLTSTSHDGTMKVWDIRSSLPLHTVRALPKEEKGLCLAWQNTAMAKDTMDENNNDNDNNTIIYVGGTDCILKRFVL